MATAEQLVKGFGNAGGYEHSEVLHQMRPGGGQGQMRAEKREEQMKRDVKEKRLSLEKLKI